MGKKAPLNRSPKNQPLAAPNPVAVLPLGAAVLPLRTVQLTVGSAAAELPLHYRSDQLDGTTANVSGTTAVSSSTTVELPLEVPLAKPEGRKRRYPKRYRGR